jgi:hypothetical protein
MEFSIPVAYEMWGCVNVQAKDERDLAKKLKSKDFINKMPLPDDPSYVEESYEIDTEGINGGLSMTDDFKPGPRINLTDKELKDIDHPTWDEDKETGKS